MENRRTEPDRDVMDQRREVIPPVAPHEQPARVVGMYETVPEVIPPVGPRVRWGEVMSCDRVTRQHPRGVILTR